MKFNKNSLPLILVLAVALLLQSCNKSNSAEYIDQLDITVTNYDSEFDFENSGFQTFTIRDSVVVLNEDLDEDDLEDWYEGESQEIVAELRNQFEQMGYTYVSDMTSADFAVNPVVFAFSETYTSAYPYYWGPGYYDYWGWYGGWYGGFYPGYWGGYWGYYPWHYSSTTVSYGNLVVEMVDAASINAYSEFIVDKTVEELESINPADVPELKFLWQASISGILTRDSKYNMERAQRGIDEAFESSPYLRKQHQ